jgi:hypothetical protein
MSITCQICNTEFEKIIPWQHLKTHGVTTDEYKLQYGNVYSRETLDRLASRIPHNKGKKLTDPIVLSTQRAGYKKREERYKSGELIRGKVDWTAERKQHASQKQSEYATNNPSLMKTRTQKAIQTKIDNGYDFGSSTRGRAHTDAEKESSRQNAYRVNAVRREKSNVGVLDRIETSNLILLNDINSTDLHLHCNSCNTEFTFTKQYLQPSKFRETICPTCYPRVTLQSKGELDLYEFVKTVCSDAISGYRSHYHNAEVDILIPSLNLGFEYNGLYWHSEEVLNHNNYSAKKDYLKQLKFSDQGIRIIPIFSDEWETQQDIVKSRITNILGRTNNIIYARKCAVKEISSKDASVFCNENHIMGTGRSNSRFGLYYNNELVSVMTFSKNNLSRKANGWELNRFASKLFTTVVGGASKLFKAFIQKNSPDTILTYADNRWSNGNLYAQLQFTKENNGTPNYWYFKPGSKRIHRFSLRKNKNDNQDLTEYENRLAQGYLRIWDCGSSKWLWTNDSK